MVARWAIPNAGPVPLKTLIDVVKEIGDWVVASGFTKLFIVNSHVTNFAPLRCALEMLRAEHNELMVAVINTADISDRVRQAHFHDADDWHANDAETALMLALSPAMVRPEKITAADDPDRTESCVFSHPVNRTSKNGVTGFPSQANTEKGQQLFSWMVDDLAAVFNAGISEQPPLPYGYHEKIE